MGLEISAAPLGSPTDGENSSIPAQSPQSSQAGFNSPWINPTSPDLGTSPIFDRKHASMNPLLGNSSDRVENANPGLGLRDSRQEKQHPSHPIPLSSHKKKGIWKTMTDLFMEKFMKKRWSMIVFIVLGSCCSVAHHFLYDYLDGRDAQDQDWWLRLGQFIAFIAKAGFVVCVNMAQQQTAWIAVRKKDYTVEAVDSLFGASHNIMELFNIEVLKKAWLTVILSLYIWISPLVIIFASITLTVSPGFRVQQNVMCSAVRTLNFSQEAPNEWDKPRRAEGDGLIGISLSFWERTGAQFEDDDSVDYWSAPSSQFKAIANNVFTANQSVQREGVAEEICGVGWNCSTVIHFVGPGYKCASVTPESGILIEDFAGVEAPFNMTELAPEGNHTYFARTQDGDYGDQIELEDGKPVQRPPYPAHLGAFKADPIIWLGYTTVENISEQQPQEKGAPGWDTAYKPAVLACEHYVVNYTVELKYEGGLQTYNVTHRDYMHKVIDTVYQETLDEPTDGLLNGVVAVPEENYVLPTPKENMERYRLIAAYYSFGRVVREMLNGEIKLPSHISRSGVLITRLMDKHDYIAVPNLQDELRRLYEDLLISLLSNPQLLVVSWAANPSELSGTASAGPQYPCSRSRYSNIYVYHWKPLASVYAISCGIALVGAISAIHAMRQNNVPKQLETSFSAFVAATNNLKLDPHVDKEKAKIRYINDEREDTGQAHGFKLLEEPDQDNSLRSGLALDDKPVHTTKAKETPVSPV